MALSAVPDGAFIRQSGMDGPALVLGKWLFPYTPGGYVAPVARGKGSVSVLTPKPTLEVLRKGYVPTLHETAQVP